MHVKVEIDIVYDDDSLDCDIVSELEHTIATAISRGLLTGETSAVVDNFEVIFDVT